MASPGPIIKFPNGAAIEAHRIAAIRPARAEETYGVNHPPMVFVEASDRESRVYLFTNIKVATDEEAEKLSRELVTQWEAALASTRDLGAIANVVRAAARHIESLCPRPGPYHPDFAALLSLAERLKSTSMQSKN